MIDTKKEIKRRELLLRFPEETGLTFEEWVDIYWMKKLEFEYQFQKKIAKSYNLDETQLHLIMEGVKQKFK